MKILFLAFTFVFLTSPVFSMDNPNLSALGITYNFNGTGAVFYYGEKPITDKYKIRFVVESLLPTHIVYLYRKGKEFVDTSYTAQDVFESKQGAFYEHIHIKLPITRRVTNWELGISPSISFSTVSARTNNLEFENFKTVSAGIGIIYIMNWNDYLQTSVLAGGDALFMQDYTSRINYRGKLEVSTKIILNEYIGFYVSTGVNGIRVHEPGQIVGNYNSNNYLSPIIKLGIIKPFIRN